MVQGATHQEIEPGENHYVAQHCLACARVHIVNPMTGKLLSESGPTAGSER